MSADISADKTALLLQFFYGFVHVGRLSAHVLTVA